MSFATNIDPMAVRTTAVDLVSDQPSGSGGTFHYHQIAELHRYVNENITYVPDPRTQNYVAPPEETLETGAGDCDCQAVLVASLFEAIGATTRIVVCEATDGSRHALPEVYLASSEGGLQEVFDSLGRYYTDYGIDYGYFAYDHADGRYWFLADTAMGEYVGDRSLLTANDYILGGEGGGWEWHDAQYYYP